MKLLTEIPQKYLEEFKQERSEENFKKLSILPLIVIFSCIFVFVTIQVFSRERK